MLDSHFPLPLTPSFDVRYVRYIWVVTFHEVYEPTAYGYVLQPLPGDLPAMQAQSSLTGSGARVWIGDKSGAHLYNSKRDT
jgi:hypothetical protein